MDSGGLIYNSPGFCQERRSYSIKTKQMAQLSTVIQNNSESHNVSHKSLPPPSIQIPFSYSLKKFTYLLCIRFFRWQMSINTWLPLMVQNITGKKMKLEQGHKFQGQNRPSVTVIRCHQIKTPVKPVPLLSSLVQGLGTIEATRQNP